MEPSLQKFRLILGWSAVSVLCSVIVGMFFYQGEVFIPYYHTFIFVADAAVSALFFFTLHFVGRKFALFALAVLYVIYIGPLTHASQSGQTLGFTIFFAATPFAVWVYYTNFYEPGRLNTLWHPFVLGGLCASTTILARILVLATGNWHYSGSWLDFPRAVFPEDWMAFLLGVGIGIGFMLTAYRPFRRFVSLPA